MTDDSGRSVVDRLLDAMERGQAAQTEVLTERIRGLRAETIEHSRELRDVTAALRSFALSNSELAASINSRNTIDRVVMIVLILAILALAGVNVAAQWGTRSLHLGDERRTDAPAAAADPMDETPPALRDAPADTPVDAASRLLP